MNAVASERMKGIGGSDAAAAVGLSEWKSPYELWLEKIGAAPPPDLSDNESVRFGALLEDVVAEEFARRRGVRVWRQRSTLYHRTHNFMFAHIDRRIVGAREGLECKTASVRMAKRWGEENTDEIPIEYWAQAAHYLAVTGYDGWHVAVLIGGNDFRMYYVPRDDEAIAALIERELAFWECVKTGVPPDPMTLEDVKVRWPSHIEAKRVNATPEIVDALARFKEINAQIKALEKEQEPLEIAVKSFMADAAELVDERGKVLCTWKQAKASRVFDKDRFAQENPELYERYLVERPGSRRFLVK